MFFLNLDSSVYFCFDGENVIALSLKRNRYYLIPVSSIKYINTIIKNKLIPNFDNNNFIFFDDPLLNEYAKYFLEIGILSKSPRKNPSKPIDLEKKSTGNYGIFWNLDSDSLNKNVKFFDFLLAYYYLVKVFLLLKFFGFNGLIKSIKNIKGPYFDKKNTDFNFLVSALNKACFYFPVRVKCLEWSSSLVFLVLRRRWKCDLQIGVQNMPFIAHAWVKSIDGVVSDNKDLEKTLNVILSEPFGI